MGRRALSRLALPALALASLLTASCAGGAVPGAAQPGLPGSGVVVRVEGMPAQGVLPQVQRPHVASDLAPLEALEALEAALLARVNADRAAHGLRPVAFDAQLLATARARAADQVGAAALSHDDALGPLAFRRRLREAGVAFSLAGENLARPRVAGGAGAAQVAAETEKALMASATHRENILEPRFDRMAVGAARGADGQVVFAQIFRAS